MVIYLPSFYFDSRMRGLFLFTGGFYCLLNLVDKRLDKVIEVCYGSVMKSKKWKLADKQRRNERLVKFADEHPDYTHKALGGIFHIHPSRVTRILNKYRANYIKPIIVDDAQMPEIPDN